MVRRVAIGEFHGELAKQKCCVSARFFRQFYKDSYGKLLTVVKLTQLVLMLVEPIDQCQINNEADVANVG